MQKTNPNFERLEKLVADTAAAIRLGDFTSMAALAAETDSAMSEISSPLDPARIAVLRDLAERNAQSLQAAAKGVRAARHRFAEVMAARSGVTTYDQIGKTVKIGTPDGTVRARF